jgi:hypothetical protein
MANPPIKLKGLLQDKHWQTHRTFCAEYDKAARSVDAALVGAGPSRAQLHRWLSGELLGLPHSDHCRVLETMFPGWTARELFAAAESDNVGMLLEVIDDRLETPDSSSVGWRNESRSVGVRLLPGASSTGDHAQLIGRRLLHLQQVRRLSDAETVELGGLTGNVVDLHDKRTITIAANGSAEILYECDILNLSDNPITKIAKELWFEHTNGHLDISALPDSERRVVINRRHDTANLSKFALGITPPIQPGEAARISFACRARTARVLAVARMTWPSTTSRPTSATLTSRGKTTLRTSESHRDHPAPHDPPSPPDSCQSPTGYKLSRSIRAPS